MSVIDNNHDEFYEDDAQKDKYITFLLGNEEYAIEIRYVNEIVGLQKITELPDMPVFIRGVINLRGRVYPIIDMRMRFSMQNKEYNARTCIIIVNFEDTNIGLIVDEVKEVIDIPEEQVDPPPKTGRQYASRFIQGTGKVGDTVKIILNVAKILSDEELEKVETI